MSRYDGPGQWEDHVRDLAVGPDGSRLFVTGRSSGQSFFDNATVAYAPNSEELSAPRSSSERSAPLGQTSGR